MSYIPAATRYDSMIYNRCGNSGLLLPALSLGLWHNFGGVDDFENGRAIVRAAFDHGITHIDLANNYGPPPGSAEENFGTILKKDFSGTLRDELVISSKAGYLMWPGPYGDWGSRKYLMASLHQSLKRMQLNYVDIFYSHRLDPNTPLEETMKALHDIVQAGKALYVGISSYNQQDTQKAVALLNSWGTPCLIHQPKYSMLERWVEGGLMDTLESAGVGCIAFSPLAQGLLTDKYLQGNIPSDSRAAKLHGALQSTAITPALLHQLTALHEIAQARGQSLAQMAISWLLKDKRVTSVLVGVSNVAQLHNNLASLQKLSFDPQELARIDGILKGA